MMGQAETRVNARAEPNDFHIIGTIYAATSAMDAATSDIGSPQDKEMQICGFSESRSS